MGRKPQVKCRGIDGHIDAPIIIEIEFLLDIEQRQRHRFELIGLRDVIHHGSIRPLDRHRIADVVVVIFSAQRMDVLGIVVVIGVLGSRMRQITRSMTVEVGSPNPQHHTHQNKRLFFRQRTSVLSRRLFDRSNERKRRPIFGQIDIRLECCQRIERLEKCRQCDFFVTRFAKSTTDFVCKRLRACE